MRWSGCGGVWGELWVVVVIGVAKIAAILLCVGIEEWWAVVVVVAAAAVGVQEVQQWERASWG